MSAKSKSTNNAVLADFLDLDVFAAQVDRDPRTVRRWMNKPNGLPFTRIGNRVLVHVPTARAWILSQTRKPNPRRKAAA